MKTIIFTCFFTILATTMLYNIRSTIESQIENKINKEEKCRSICDPRFGIIDQETGECYCATEKIIEENIK